DARQDRDVLLPVGSLVAHGLADDSRADLELPQKLAGLRVDRLEPAVHRSVKHDVARGRKRARPDRELLFQAPDLRAANRIPRVELAAMAAGARVHLDVRSDERRYLDVVRLHALFVLAEVVVRDV